MKNVSTPSHSKSQPLKPQSKPRLLFLVANDVYFCTHRLNLAKAAMSQGFEVALATKNTSAKYTSMIEDAGIKIFSLKKFDRGTINPYKQILILQELHKIYQHYRPDIVHHVAIKPVVFGTIIAKLCHTPRVVNALGGLGYIFTDSNEENNSEKKIQERIQARIQNRIQKFKKIVLRLGIRSIFRWLFSNPNTTLILQNQDDIDTLTHFTHISKQRIVLIPGAGVDINAFPALPPPNTSSPVVITCISRMLWDKGIGELVEAAQLIQKSIKRHTTGTDTTETDKSKHPDIKIILYGTPDPENPASIDTTTLEKWNSSGIIEWRGYCENVVDAYQETHIAVLPSYREGLPKSLLEAASCARPIVTTNVPGCREIVVHQENGLLVPPKNAEALAHTLIQLCKDEHLRNQMGQCSRQRVERYFHDRMVHNKTIELYNTK